MLESMRRMEMGKIYAMVQKMIVGMGQRHDAVWRSLISGSGSDVIQVPGGTFSPSRRRHRCAGAQWRLRCPLPVPAAGSGQHDQKRRAPRGYTAACTGGPMG